MQIHPGGLDDAQVIALLQTHLAAAHAESPPESCHALDVRGLTVPEVRFFGVWDDETLLAVGAWKRLPDIHGASHGEIKSMHTAAPARGRGVAGALLSHLIEDARAHGITRLSLETGSMAYFRAARALYARHGFTECPPFGDYVLDPNSMFMTREVG
jgi:putative acetyltransferase